MVTCPCGLDYKAVLRACPACKTPKRAARLATPGLSSQQRPPVASSAQGAVGQSQGANSPPTRVRPVVVVAIIVVAGIALWGMTQGGDQAPAAKPQANSVTNTKPSTTGSGAIIKSYKVEYRTGSGKNTMDVRYATSTGYEQKNNMYNDVFKDRPKVVTMRSGDTASLELMVRDFGTARCIIQVNGRTVSENSAEGAGAVAYCAAELP
jgi:hypothetical protein